MSVADKITRLSNARDDIIDALGTKGVTATGHGFEDFADDIESILSGGSVIISDTIDSHGGTIREITTTGDVVMLQEKTVTPSTSAQTVVPSSGYNGMTQVTVNPIPSQYIIPSGTSEISSNGIYDVGAFASAIVSVPVPSEYIIPTGTSEITENGMYDIRSYSSVNVSVAGDSGDIDAFITRTISGTYTNSTVTLIGSYAFGYCSSLVSVSFPQCSYIGTSAFHSCSNLTTISFPKCELINTSAFYYCSKLTTALFPECITIGSNAFYSCCSLTMASFPKCTSIGTSAFYSCSNLATISFPECSYIQYDAFYCCYPLTTAAFPKCSIIGNRAFYYCNLTTISFPECKSIGNSAFYRCDDLTTVLFPKCTSIGSGAFYSCYSLTTASFPECSYIGSSAFYSCMSLTTVSFPKCSYIGASAFYGCFKLESFNAPVYSVLTGAFVANYSLSLVVFSYSGNLVMNSINASVFSGNTRLLSLYLINSPAIYRLANVNAFTSTPIAGHTAATDGVYGSIFVPASLYDSYITATNWATYSERFVSLTDAEIEALPF